MCWFLPSIISMFVKGLGGILGEFKGFPGGSVVKNLPANAGDACMIPGWGRSPGEGKATQYSFLGNPMDRGAWWATVHGVGKESDFKQ